jgi:hypothetical protein
MPYAMVTRICQNLCRHNPPRPSDCALLVLGTCDTVSLDIIIGGRVSEDDGTVLVCERDWTISLTTSNETGKCRITIFTQIYTPKHLHVQRRSAEKSYRQAITQYNHL